MKILISLFFVILLILKIVYKSKYEKFGEELKMIEPYVSPFHKLDMNVVIDEEVQPITGTIVRVNGTVLDERINKLFKYVYENDTKPVNMSKETWITMINGNVMIRNDISDKEFLYVMRYVLNEYSESDEYISINLDSISRIDKSHLVSEKINYFTRMISRRDISDNCILNKQLYKTLKESKKNISIKEINIFVTTSNSEDLYFNNTDGFYKKHGILHSTRHGEIVIKPIIGKMFDRIFY